MSKSGNRRLRKTMIELAWFWLRHQPDSALSRWFTRASALEGTNGRIAIVALARKLLVALCATSPKRRSRVAFKAASPVDDLTPLTPAMAK